MDLGLSGCLGVIGKCKTSRFAGSSGPNDLLAA